MKVSLHLQQEILTVLSMRQRRLLQLKWNAIVLDPCAFVPSDERKTGVDSFQAQAENESYGAFAGATIRSLLLSVSAEATIQAGCHDRFTAASSPFSSMFPASPAVGPRRAHTTSTKAFRRARQARISGHR